jgi:hypothetical protein
MLDALKALRSGARPQDAFADTLDALVKTCGEVLRLRLDDVLSYTCHHAARFLSHAPIVALVLQVALPCAD